MNDPLLVILAELLVIAVAPISWFATQYLWRLHGLDRATDPREPKPLMRLTFVKAVNGTIATCVSTYLAALSLLRLGGHPEIALTVTPITLLAFVLLDVIPITSALYLRSLRTQPMWGAIEDQRQEEADDAGTEDALDQATGGVRGAEAKGLLEAKGGPDLERDVP